MHSDVGGTFDDDLRLPTIALKWIVDGALDQSLVLKPGAYRRALSVSTDHALGTVHRMSRIWALLTYRRRRVPDTAAVHDSVRSRIAAQPAYGKRIPASATWADPDWLTPRG